MKYFPSFSSKHITRKLTMLNQRHVILQASVFWSADNTQLGWVPFANIFSLWAACPLFIRDKQRADCGAAEPGPHAVWGPRETEREGRSLSNIINLHSPFAVARVGTAGCALLHCENVDTYLVWWHRLSWLKIKEWRFFFFLQKKKRGGLGR